MAEQARREDTRIVEHQQIASSQIPFQLCKRAVLNVPGPMEHEQPRRAARFRRVLSDQGFGELKIKV